MIANPINGKESHYIASHAYAVEGMNVQEGANLIDAVMTAVTSPELIYSHSWPPPLPL